MKVRHLITAVSALLAVNSAHGQALFNEVEYSPEETVFTLVASQRPTLRLYNDGLGGTAYREIRMKRAKKSPLNAAKGYLWITIVKGDLRGQFYTFDIGRGETPGLFAKAVGCNGVRGAVVDMAQTNPKGWSNDRRLATKSPLDLVIWEVHVRDFSIDASSKLKYKGKYLAFTEPKAVDYLKKLGINAVHLQPVFDFASIDETRLDTPQYNWGYDPLNYNVPEGSYATDPYTPETRIREFKEMVMALHKAGIRVIFDAVYNHTMDIEHSNFDRTFPHYYYRYNTDGTPSNGSGCGNETASEKPLMREFMLESMAYWAEEYHIDGFRVDLMGVHDIETMNILRKRLTDIDPSIIIYGEGWSAGQCAYPQEKLATKANIGHMPGIEAFCDDMRDALRGPFSDDMKGAFLAGIAGQEESLKAGIVGMTAHPQVDYSAVNYSEKALSEDPQIIAYVSCHDDMCLTDRLRAELPGITSDELIHLDLLAQTCVFTSQGVSFMLAGEEMLRTKLGVHNSFNAPDSVNHLDWTALEQHPEVLEYYKGLIHMRLNHKAFRLGSGREIARRIKFMPTKPCFVGFSIDARGLDDSWKTVIVLLNSGKEARQVPVPEGRYTIVCQDGKINEQGLGTLSGSEATVNPQSALIIHD